MTKPNPTPACKTCGKTFVKPWKRAIYCSVQCQLAPRLTEQAAGCWLWTGAVNNHGYGQVNVNGVRRYVHRLMFAEHKGEIPEGAHLLHSCDTPNCCNPAHLAVGAAKDNLRDMANKGRSTRSLSEQQVKEIRALRGIVSGVELAKRYGVTKTTISLWQRRDNAFRR